MDYTLRLAEILRPVNKATVPWMSRHPLFIELGFAMIEGNTDQAVALRRRIVADLLDPAWYRGGGESPMVPRGNFPVYPFPVFDIHRVFTIPP